MTRYKDRRPSSGRAKIQTALLALFIRQQLQILSRIEWEMSRVPYGTGSFALSRKLGSYLPGASERRHDHG